MTKLFGVICTAVLFLLLGTSVPLCAQQPDEDKDRPEAKPTAQEEKRDEAKPRQEEKQGQANSARQQDEKHAQPAQRGQRGGRIPEDRFRANFGREHKFHVNRVTVVNGAPQFVYSSYTFILVDPWPVGWYYTDDCYIDFIDDEYFLFDLAHPGVRVALNVIF